MVNTGKECSLKSGYATEGSVRLWYEEQGQGEAVVFLHGFTCDVRVWDEQFLVFAERYRSVRYDLRGYGRSSLPKGRYSHVEDLAGLLGVLGINKAHLVGMSMGGSVALSFAVEYPERVRSLVLAGAGLREYPWSDEFMERFKSYPEIARREGIEAAKKAFLNDPFLEQAAKQPAVLERYRQILEDYSGHYWVHPDEEVGIRPAAIHRLDEVRVPTLVIRGERDIPDVVAISERLYRGIKGARMAVIEGAGHVVNMERPAEFNEAVLAFLESL
jgi:pimeloyl-ACP methyl ester carboxylesterase